MATQHTVYKRVAYILARVMLITIYELSEIDSPLHFFYWRETNHDTDFPEITELVNDEKENQNLMS